MTARGIAALFAQMEMRLISSLKKNLEGHKGWERDAGFAWPAWQAEKIRNLERFRRQNRTIRGEYQRVIGRETEAMLREQFAEGGTRVDGEIAALGRTPLPDSAFFGVNAPRLESLIEDIQNAESRAESAAMRLTEDVYRRTILQAETALAAGAATLPRAVDMATREFLAKGIDCIRYRDGRRVNIASYAEMALRTAATRSYLQGEAKRREEYGVDTVLVSQYGACSPTCLPWQGKVYIDDVWGTFAGETYGAMGKSRNGKWYPLLSVAVSQGLFHPNCRHTLSTWYEGVSRMPKPMDAAGVSRAAALEARQRAKEREVRKWKRLAEGTQDPAKAVEYRRKVRTAQKDLREFIKNHGDVLKRDYWRERAFTPALYEVGLKPVPATEEAIAAVPVVESTFFPPGKLQELHRDLLREVMKYPLDTEVQRSYAKDGRLLLERAGAGGTVKLKQFREPYFVMHNHPDTNTFSIGDVSALAIVPGLAGISAVGNNGAVYLLEKTQSFDANLLLKACERWRNDFQLKPQTAQNAVEEMERFINEVKLYGLKFISVVP